MALVKNWKKAHTWFSTQVFAVLGVLPLVWSELPQELKDQIPEGWGKWIVAGVAAGGIALRLVKQGEDDEGEG